MTYLCSKQNRKYKTKYFQHDYRKKWIEELKTLTKHISCKCKFDVRKCNSKLKVENADVSVKIGKNIVCIKKDTSWKMLRLIKMNTNNQLKKKILKMVHVII